MIANGNRHHCYRYSSVCHNLHIATIDDLRPKEWLGAKL